MYKFLMANQKVAKMAKNQSYIQPVAKQNSWHTNTNVTGGKYDAVMQYF